MSNKSLLLGLGVGLLLALHIEAATQSVYVNPFMYAQNPCATIRNGEFVCLDCATLAFCIQEGGNWVTMQIHTCDTDKFLFCNEKAVGCTMQKECEVPTRGLPFECQNPGTYPDPYNCKYYHSCDINNVDQRHVCNNGWGYSALTKTCSVPTNSEQCTQPQYKCDKPGRMAAWPGDENIFYICLAKFENGEQVLFPRLYRCPDDRIFDGVECVYRTSNPGGSASTGTTSIVTVRPTQPTTSITSAVTPGSCVERRLTPDPNDCHGYFLCRNSELIPYKCPAGHYFQSMTSTCKFGDC